MEKIDLIQQINIEHIIYAFAYSLSQTDTTRLACLYYSNVNSLILSRRNHCVQFFKKERNNCVRIILDRYGYSKIVVQIQTLDNNKIHVDECPAARLYTCMTLCIYYVLWILDC